MTQEQSVVQEEFLQLQPNLAAAKLGCFLILPLKYDPESLCLSPLEGILHRTTLSTMDVNENIKAMLNSTDSAAVGSCYTISRDGLLKELFPGKPLSRGSFFTVSAENGPYTFDFRSAYLYLFHTQVAFLCLGLSFDRMETIRQICNPGYAENRSEFSLHVADGTVIPFSLDTQLRSFCSKMGLLKFFDGESSILLEGFTYMLALVPERFQTLSAIRQTTFHLHLMAPLDTFVEDDSEEDVRYVYAVKDQRAGSYRWGCCVSSQTISYAVADAAMDFDAELHIQACDGLPVVLLALYEKYTCLRFTELLTHTEKKQIKRLRTLKRLMLNFQAYGTVTPANLSRWHNVKRIYACLLEVNEITSAIQDIDGKLRVLTEHQREVESTRNEAVTNIITIFGVVSILASMLSIIQILSGGDSFTWIITILTSILLAVITVITVFLKK